MGGVMTMACRGRMVLMDLYSCGIEASGDTFDWNDRRRLETFFFYYMYSPFAINYIHFILLLNNIRSFHIEHEKVSY